jgi:hypothetical protein
VTSVERLEQLAEKAEAKAAEARAKIEAEREAQVAKRAERELAYDEQILATAAETRERLRRSPERRTKTSSG